MTILNLILRKLVIALIIMSISYQICQSFRSHIRSMISTTSLKATCKTSKLYGSSNISSSTNSNNNLLPKKSVTVVGGGFGGLYTALKLEELVKDQNVEITLVDRKEKFVFLPLLYELTVGAASLPEVAPLYSDLLRNSKVKFNKGLVSKINFDLNNVEVTKDDSKETIRYDYLVLTPGAQPRTDMIPGAREHAIPFYQAENAYELRMKLEKLKSSEKELIRVIVVGGGYSGVEIATNIAEYLGKKRGNVSLIDRNSKLLPSSPEYNRKTAERCLQAAGVSILSDKSVENISSDSITLSERKDGKIIYEFNIPADIVILTSGTEPNSLIQSLDLEKSSYGKILINQELKVKNLNNVYASGDCSQIDGVLLPSTAQVAMQQAQTIAKNLATELSNTNGKVKLEDFHYMPLGEMLTLGFKEASITGFGGLIQIDGPTAALARRIAYAARMPTPTQTINALLYAGISTASKLVSTIQTDLKTR